MRRDRILTVVLLLGAFALVILAWNLAAHHTGADHEYRTMTAPFPAGSIGGRVFGPAGYEPVGGELPSGCTRKPLVAGSGGGLAETVVALEEIHGGIAPTMKGPALAVDHCGISPRISAATEGTVATIAVGSGDHRLQATLNGVRVFDATATGTARIALVSPGFWSIRCASGHPWEEAWIYVAASPYTTVTGVDGTFHLGDVPAGHYRLHAWHAGIGDRSTDVLVEANRPAEAVLRF